MVNTYLSEHQKQALGNIKEMLKGVAETQKLHTQRFDTHSGLLEKLDERMEQQEELTRRIIDILLGMNNVLTQAVADIAEIKAEIKPEIKP